VLRVFWLNHATSFNFFPDEIINGTRELAVVKSSESSESPPVVLCPVLG
jgi:hypothetical protein